MPNTTRRKRHHFIDTDAPRTQQHTVLISPSQLIHISSAALSRQLSELHPLGLQIMAVNIVEISLDWFVKGTGGEWTKEEHLKFVVELRKQVSWTHAFAGIAIREAVYQRYETPKTALSNRALWLHTIRRFTPTCIMNDLVVTCWALSGCIEYLQYGCEILSLQPCIQSGVSYNITWFCLIRPLLRDVTYRELLSTLQLPPEPTAHETDNLVVIKKMHTLEREGDGPQLIGLACSIISNFEYLLSYWPILIVFYIMTMIF